MLCSQITKIRVFLLLKMSSRVAQYQSSPSQWPQLMFLFILKCPCLFKYANIMVEVSKMRRKEDSRKKLRFSTNFGNLSIITYWWLINYVIYFLIIYREYHKNDLHAIASRLRGQLPIQLPYSQNFYSLSTIRIY